MKRTIIELMQIERQVFDEGVTDNEEIEMIKLKLRILELKVKIEFVINKGNEIVNKKAKRN